MMKKGIKMMIMTMMKVMNSNDDEDINDDNFDMIVVFNFDVVVVLNFENEFKFCENVATNDKAEEITTLNLSSP